METKKKNEVEKPLEEFKSSEIIARVLNRVNEMTEIGALTIPKDYSPENALKYAMIILGEQQDKNGKHVFEVCTKASISAALFKMVIQGLSPAKGQGYFIPYGNDLTWVRSYQGSIALAKRFGNVSQVNANVIYKGDDFSFIVDAETGRKKIAKHDQRIENIKNENIVGAYAVTVFNDGSTDLEIMTIDEIRQAWGQGATKGNSPAHKNFSQEMAKKTVINRACKTPINSSSDENLFSDGSERSQLIETEDITHEVINETGTVTLDLPDVATDPGTDSPY